VQQAGEQVEDRHVQRDGRHDVVGLAAVNDVAGLYRIRPDISSTNIADTASDRPGMLKKIAPRPARKATRMPTIRKPPMKLKSLRVVSA
jgi:hypothetical protein